MDYSRQTFLFHSVPGCLNQGEIWFLIKELDPIMLTAVVQRKASSHCRLESWAQLVQNPAMGREIANLNKAVLVLESDDGVIPAKTAPVVQG